MWIRVCLSIAVVAVLTQNVFVHRTNRQMKEARERLARDVVERGDLVREIVGLDLDGKRTAIDLLKGSQKTLVFNLSLDCPFCDRSLPAWRRLGKAAAANGYNVIFVSKDAFTASSDECA